jgi:hypothetical protein
MRMSGSVTGLNFGVFGFWYLQKLRTVPCGLARGAIEILQNAYSDDSFDGFGRSSVTAPKWTVAVSLWIA